MDIFITIFTLVLLGAIYGAIDQGLNGTSAASFLLCMVAGVLGGALGPWLANRFGLPHMWVPIGSSQISIVWVIVGGAIFAAVGSIIIRRRG